MLPAAVLRRLGALPRRRRARAAGGHLTAVRRGSTLRRPVTQRRAGHDSATVTIMEKGVMSTVIVSDGERQLVYRIVNGEAGDERLTIERVDEPTLDEMLADERSRQMTPDEFQAHFGQLPLTANE
jgi:hypothetical protein